MDITESIMVVYKVRGQWEKGIWSYLWSIEFQFYKIEKSSRDCAIM